MELSLMRDGIRRAARSDRNPQMIWYDRIARKVEESCDQIPSSASDSHRSKQVSRPRFCRRSNTTVVTFPRFKTQISEHALNFKKRWTLERLFSPNGCTNIESRQKRS